MVRKAFSRRLEVLASYTRSRTLGDSSQDFGFENRADMRSLEETRSCTTVLTSSTCRPSPCSRGASS